MTRLQSIDQIEKELTRLYEEKGRACRASLFNFVVWVPSLAQSGYFRELIQKASDKFPCRLIFIAKTEAPTLEIDVSIDIKPNLACDLIELKAPKDEVAKLPYLLLPLLLPDLPIFFLWGQDPTVKSELYDTLSPYATRIIFDSASCENLKTFASSYLKRPDKKLRDINWSLLSGWRHTISRVIDTPEKYQAAKQATLIDITYKEGPATQALYLQAYLLSKLPSCAAHFTLTPTSGEGFEGDI